MRCGVWEWGGGGGGPYHKVQPLAARLYWGRRVQVTIGVALRCYINCRSPAPLPPHAT